MNQIINSVSKQKFKLEQKSDGSIYTAEHRIIEGHAIKRILFKFVTFNTLNNLFIAVDKRNNIFVYDLISLESWALLLHIPGINVAHFMPYKKATLFVGTKSGSIHILDITGSGTIRKSVKLFDTEIQSISFSAWNLAVTATLSRAIIFDIKTMEFKHELHTIPLIIKQLAFIPNSVKIFGSFDDDHIHIWTNSSFKLFKQIDAMRSQERVDQDSTAIRLNLDFSILDENRDRFRKFLTKDVSKGHVSFVAFSENAQKMCVTTVDGNILLFSTVSWKIEKIIHTVSTSITFCQYLGKELSGNYLVAMTSDGDAVLVNIDKMIQSGVMLQGSVRMITISSNSQMFAVIVKTGELIINNINFLINKLKMSTVVNEVDHQERGDNNRNMMDEALKKIIPQSRLLPLLTECGEYPAKYRYLIWPSLLNLPRNNAEFKELLSRGLHPCVENYDRLYPLKDISLLRNLKRIISCLVYWCPVFAQSSFLTEFVFPFLKLYESDLRTCFETVATLIWNHGQLWFEFSPLEPINFLGLIENILNYFEPSLLSFYQELGITSTTFAWSLAKSAFAEVLDASQWQQIWDHLISNPSYFLIFCIVAYNVTNKQIIKNLKSVEDVKRFFEEENYVNMKKLIAKAHNIMETCPKSLHPMRYMYRFEPLYKGFYSKFLKYPRKILESQINDKEVLEKDNKMLNQRLYELEKAELNLKERRSRSKIAEEYANRMQEVEKAYEKALIREYDRLALQRKEILCFEREILLKTDEMNAEAKLSTMEQNLKYRERELETLLHSLERSRINRDYDLLLTETNLKRQNLDLDLNSVDCEMIGNGGDLRKRFQMKIQQLDEERLKLQSDVSRIKGKMSTESTSAAAGAGAAPVTLKQKNEKIKRMENISIASDDNFEIAKVKKQQLDLLNELEIEIAKLLE